jgi:predicted nucleotidyltransferase
MSAPIVPADLERSLTEYRRLLEIEFGARLRPVRLFGSRARGDADPQSDADVSVVVEGLTEDERTRVVELALTAWRHAGCRGPLLAPLPWSEAEQETRRAAERRIALDIEQESIPL